MASLSLNLTSLLAAAAADRDPVVLPTLSAEDDDEGEQEATSGEGKKVKWTKEMKGILFSAIAKHNAHIHTKGMPQKVKWELVVALLMKNPMFAGLTINYNSVQQQWKKAVKYYTDNKRPESNTSRHEELSNTDTLALTMIEKMREQNADSKSVKEGDRKRNSDMIALEADILDGAKKSKENKMGDTDDSTSTISNSSTSSAVVTPYDQALIDIAKIQDDKLKLETKRLENEINARNEAKLLEEQKLASQERIAEIAAAATVKVAEEQSKQITAIMEVMKKFAPK